MRITEDATEAILGVMKNNQLDPQKYSMYFCNPPGGGEGLAFNFVENEIGKHLKFGDLNVILALDVDMEGVVVDLREVDGRTGLVFTGEQYVSH